MRPRRENGNGFIGRLGQLERALAAAMLLCVFLACGEESGVPTSPPQVDIYVTPVKAIVESPGHFYGNTVTLEGHITKEVIRDRKYEFTDGTGVINIDFLRYGIPTMNTPFQLTGIVQRAFEGVEVVITEKWKYPTPERRYQSE